MTRRPVAFVSVSVLARLPLAMQSLLLLVHAQRLTGSFAVAGLVTGAYTAGRAGGGPWLGRLVDRSGQTRVLALSGLSAGLLLVALGVLPAGAPHPLLVVLAAAAGFASPPLNGCVRALLPEIVAADGLAAAYAFEASAMEFAFIAAPPLALGLSAVLSTGAALAVCGAAVVAGSVAFAAQPSSRRRRPAVAQPGGRAGALRSPALRMLVATFLALGVVFGATEVGVVAAAGRSAGPLLAVWGGGSLVGGAVATRLGGGARGAGGLAAILAALAVGHAALAGAGGSPLAMAAVLALAGAAISPAYASIYAMVERVTDGGRRTEAFSWLATALAVGDAAGSAAGGALAQRAGPACAFALAGAAGGLAVAAVVARSAAPPALAPAAA